MSLYARNKTGSPLPLAAGHPIVTLPASSAPPTPGVNYNVTSELRPNKTVDPINGVTGGLAAGAYALLEAQVTAGFVDYEWSSDPEYLTPGLTVSGPIAAPHVLDGPLHTVSGLTPGHVMRATAPTAASFGQPQHDDLGGVGATDHHSNANDPAAGEKAALVGSFGTPGTLNPYLTRLDPSLPRKATGPRLDRWINGTTGSDANDGSTELLAVQTLARLSELIPDLLAGELVINARGVITLPPTHVPPYPSPYQDGHGKEWANFLRINALAQRMPFVLWDGGPDRVVVADDGGSDYVSDINSVVAPTPTIGHTGAGWTPNQFRGYWAEVTSGPAAGMLALIESNTVDTLNLLHGFDPFTPTDPGLGASFRIVRPATELTSAPGDWTDFCIQQTGDGSMLQFQRMFISGGVSTTVLNGNAGLHQMRMSQVIIDTPFALYPLSFEFCFGITHLSGWVMDPSDLTSAWYDFAGVGICALTPIPMLWEYSHGHLWISTSVIPQAAFGPCTNAPSVNNSKIESLTLYDCKGHWSWVISPAFWMPPGFEKVKVGGFRWPGVPVATEPGIQCHVSDAELVGAIIEDTDVGIMLFNSTVTLSDISGSVGNLRAGAYAHSGSHIVTPPAANGGITPTVSGNSGTVELSADGATELAKWASIPGSPVSTPEVTAKEWKPYFWF